MVNRYWEGVCRKFEGDGYVPCWDCSDGFIGAYTCKTLNCTFKYVHLIACQLYLLELLDTHTYTHTSIHIHTACPKPALELTSDTNFTIIFVNHLNNHIIHYNLGSHYTPNLVFPLGLFYCGYTQFYLVPLNGLLVIQCVNVLWYVICDVSSICGLLRDFQFLLDNFFRSLQFFSESWAPDLEISCPWKQPLAGAFSCCFSTHPASNQAVLAYFLHLVDSVGNCQSFIIFPVGVGLVDLGWLFSNPFCPWMPEWSF